MGRLDVIDADLLGWWLAERQLKSGGLNGRPEKLPDVCYRLETCGVIVYSSSNCLIKEEPNLKVVFLRCQHTCVES